MAEVAQVAGASANRALRELTEMAIWIWMEGAHVEKDLHAMPGG